MKKEEPKNIIERDGIEPREITEEMRESYLSYAMSVIVSRALPDVRDGLKPVQRRILWAMWDIGLTHTSKFKKSANVVGEVLGKYHPHGDQAVYDAMARMAQDFSLRYPLVDGQGNWGSIDGDSPAAMRYTEARLTKISAELLADIEKGTVDWVPNYDNSRVEPAYFPAKLPHLLLNGTVGIAVGMATSIPSHNLHEVVDATIYLAKHKDATTKDLMEFIPGPDFPTGGVIYDKKALEEAYATGRGSITIRAVAEIEERKSGSFQIVISEIPFQVNKSELIVKMADLAQEKRIEGIKDLRDESDRDGLRIVVELKNDAAPQKVLNQLFQYTELQKNFYFNMLALENGIAPKIFSLKDVLAAYIDHRKLMVRKRTEFDLKKAEERAHILEGLATALDVIDKIIETIKKSKDKDEARANLMKKFKLSEIQANAILEMRLQSLAALERIKIEDELKEKKKFIAECKAILKSEERIIEIITTELAELKKAYPSERKTKLISSGIKEFKEEDLIQNEEVIITLSQDGYIKRMPTTAFKAQRRGGKGLIGFELKEEDQIHKILTAETHDNILFFTDKGRVFQTKAYEIPIASRTSKGKSVHNFLTLPPNEKICSIVNYKGIEGGKKGEGTGFLVMATHDGVIKKTDFKEFANVRRTGIIAITLKDKDALQWAERSSGDDEIILVTANGQSIRFKEKDIRPMGRTASGIKAINLKGKDVVAGFSIIPKEMKDTQFLVIMGNGYAKQTPIKEYKVQKRGGSGIRTAKTTDKTGRVVGALITNPETEEVIVFSSKGQVIRTKLSDIRVAGRATQGVKVMNLDKGDTIIGIVAL